METRVSRPFVKPAPLFRANGLLDSGNEYAPSTETNALIASPQPYAANNAPPITPSHSGRPRTTASATAITRSIGTT